MFCEAFGCSVYGLFSPGGCWRESLRASRSETDTERIHASCGSVAHFRTSNREGIPPTPAARRLDRGNARLAEAADHVLPVRLRQITSSTHDERVIDAGMGLLMEDTTGKGHISEVISTVPVTQVIVQRE